jgi:RNA polymerase sigma-70 factor (ECF subfamily)
MTLTAVMINPEGFMEGQDEIARVRRGDTGALGSLIARYQHRLYRYLLRLSRDGATAEDLFQQTWVRVMEKIGRFDAGKNFDVWLFTVAHNIAMDHFRGKRMESLDEPSETGSTQADLLASNDQDALERLLDSERNTMLADCLHGLPAIHREVLALRFEEDMKLEQIAEVTTIPLSTVKSRLSRALEGLRRSVQARMAEGQP